MPKALPKIGPLLPPGKITAFREWTDDDDSDWIVGVRHSAMSYTPIATLADNAGPLAKALATHFDAMDRE